jgi:hypothetical protein
VAPYRFIVNLPVIELIAKGVCADIFFVGIALILETLNPAFSKLVVSSETITDVS